MNNKQVNIDRRNFIKKLALGSSAVYLSSSFSLFTYSCVGSDGKTDQIASILVDYNKCTGCRTCEAICSSFNRPVKKNGISVPGIGNPCYSNIKVYNYNPDADVPVVCALCNDTPCIQACPVPQDPVTKNKALFADSRTHAIKNDPLRCVGCGSCKEACESEGVGIISLDQITSMPEGICTLCNGDPRCVKYCPYDALTFEKKPAHYKFDRMSKDEIAKELIKHYYMV